jgi:hypothetical protein
LSKILVPEPAGCADADLVFQIRFVGGQVGGLIRLVILDLKTHAALWPIAEPVQGWARKPTGRQNFDKAMVALAAGPKTIDGPIRACWQ